MNAPIPKSSIISSPFISPSGSVTSNLVHFLIKQILCSNADEQTYTIKKPSYAITQEWFFGYIEFVHNLELLLSK